MSYDTINKGSDHHKGKQNNGVFKYTFGLVPRSILNYYHLFFLISPTKTTPKTQSPAITKANLPTMCKQFHVQLYVTVALSNRTMMNITTKMMDIQIRACWRFIVRLFVFESLEVLRQLLVIRFQIA